MRRIVLKSVISGLLWLALTPFLFSQSFTASLQGTVTDSSEAVVPRAQITLLNEATNVKQTKESDERGRYFFAMLPPGNYSVTVEFPGFQTFVRSGIQLQVAQEATVDVQLSPGDVSTKIVVAGEAPRLDSVSATLGRVVDNKSVLDMPLNTRDPLNLTTLTPGVVGGPGGTGTNFISSGTRNSQADVLLDGVTVTVQQYNGGVSDVKFHPTVELVQEFKVETSSFSAEYGNTGGTVVNMVTRSGTNDPHGSLFEFHRNSAFNANNFFSNRAGRAMVPFRRNQFGGSAGGPVWIPRVYRGRDRTFFFFSHEGNKQSSQATMLSSVPTLLEKQGDFTQTFDATGKPISIFDPFSVRKDAQTGNWIRTAFPGNVIPQNRWDPVGRNVVKYFPDPNSAGVPFTHVNNLFLAGSSPSDGYQTTVKIDHQVTDAQRLSARYSRVVQSSVSPNLWGNDMGPEGSNNLTVGFSTSLDYTNLINPTTILNFRWGVSRQGINNDTLSGKNITDQQLGFQTSLQEGLPPRFEAVGYYPVGPNRWSIMRVGEDVNHFVGNLTKVKGIHQFKFGGDARLYRTNHGQPGINFVAFYFDRFTTMSDPFRTDALQGNSLASMLLGWGSNRSYQDYHGHRWEGRAAFAYRDMGFYGEDKIQVTPHLTLTLGLRYELDVPRTERYNRVTWIDLSAKSPISVPQFPNLQAGLMFGSDQNRRPFDMDTNNFAPRVSLAYQFTQKMVVRTGYGIYYGQSKSGPYPGLPLGFAGRTPFTTTLDGGVTRYAALSNPFPDGINMPPGNKLGLASYLGQSLSGSIRSWATKPYYQEWSLSIQRELPANSVAEVAYTGNRGVHLYFGGMGDLNRIDPQYWSLGDRLNDMVTNPFYGVITDPLAVLSQPTVSRIQLLRPYPQFTGLSGDPGRPIANSIYHGVQFKFTKRPTHGLSVSTHYTFSKLIDDNSHMGGSVVWLGGATNLQSYNNLRLERAVSLFDMTHRWVADFAYELPFGRGKALGTNWHPVLEGVLGRWQVNGILMFQSGFPLVTALLGGILPGGTQRPNLVSDPGLSGSVESRLNRYLNPNAFTRPAPYTLGNAPRTLSSVREPGLRNADLSVFKNLSLGGEGARYVQVRLEAFNATNTPIFGGPDMTVGATSFGVIGSQANSPRQLQIAMKVYF